MLLCECGLDPGLDHMLAMEVIDKVTADGGQVGLCFVSKQKRQKLQQNTTWNTILPSQLPLKWLKRVYM